MQRRLRRRHVLYEITDGWPEHDLAHPRIGLHWGGVAGTVHLRQQTVRRVHRRGQVLEVDRQCYERMNCFFLHIYYPTQVLY